MEDILESSYLNEKIKIGEYTNEIKIIDMFNNFMCFI